MEIRLILFKEISFGISLNNQAVGVHCTPYMAATRQTAGRVRASHLHLLLRKEESRRRFFLPQVSLISILQNSVNGVSGV
jgi:DNA topoisomerase IA